MTAKTQDCEPDVRRQPTATITACNELARRIASARDAQRRWRRVPLKDRLLLIRNFRHQLVDRTEIFVHSVTNAHRQGPTETVAAELIPLADACRFLEREARRILAARRLSRGSRPLWLSGVTVQLHRDPLGVVLIVAAGNYPIFLPGVQAAQALAAGNAVLLKPGVGGTRAARALQDAWTAAGLDADLVHVLPEPAPTVKAALQAGVDKLVLTGSAETGRRLLAEASATLTPSTMELSGCDAVFVMPGADLDRLARCLAFSLRFNGGATCMAARRVFVPIALQAELERRLCEACSSLTHGTDVSTHASTGASLPESALIQVEAAIEQGARPITGTAVHHEGCRSLRGPVVLADATPEMPLLRSDILAPLMSLVPVASMEEALRRMLNVRLL